MSQGYTIMVASLARYLASSICGGEKKKKKDELEFEYSHQPMHIFLLTILQMLIWENTDKQIIHLFKFRKLFTI